MGIETDQIDVAKLGPKPLFKAKKVANALAQFPSRERLQHYP